MPDRISGSNTSTTKMRLNTSTYDTKPIDGNDSSKRKHVKKETKTLNYISQEKLLPVNLKQLSKRKVTGHTTPKKPYTTTSRSHDLDITDAQQRDTAPNKPKKDTESLLASGSILDTDNDSPSESPISKHSDGSKHHADVDDSSIYDSYQPDTEDTSDANNNPDDDSSYQSSIDDHTDGDINTDNSEKPSLLRRIFNAIREKATTKNILIIGIPMTLALAASLFTGFFGIAVLTAIGLSLLFFACKAVINVVKKVIAKHNAGKLKEIQNEPSTIKQKLIQKLINAITNRKKDTELKAEENKKDLGKDPYSSPRPKNIKQKLIQKLILIQKIINDITNREKDAKLEAEENKKDLVKDPDSLSTPQKIKQKLKAWVPIILGSMFIALGTMIMVASIFFTGGAIIPAICFLAFCATGILLLVKGIGNILDQRAAKKEFYDNNNIGTDNNDGISSNEDDSEITSEDEFPYNQHAQVTSKNNVNNPDDFSDDDDDD